MKATNNLGKQLQRLEEILSPTECPYVPEPFILTEEEAATVIHNSIELLKKQMEVRYMRQDMPKKLIEEKINAVDWLSRIDQPTILRVANSNKHYNIWQEEQRKNEREAAQKKTQEIKKVWTAGMMYKFLRWTSSEVFGKPLLENDKTMPLIKAVCLFLSDDPRFETDLGFSFNKGLLIRGKSGLGKTHIPMCVAENERNPISIHSMIEITEAIKSDGTFDIFKQSAKKIYLDDVGSEEPVVNHYGTKISWFKDFIETYYLRSKQYNRLIISTNCNHAMLEERYGFRVRSRIKDMFNVLDVDGKDLRGLV